MAIAIAVAGGGAGAAGVAIATIDANTVVTTGENAAIRTTGLVSLDAASVLTADVDADGGAIAIFLRRRHDDRRGQDRRRRRRGHHAGHVRRRHASTPAS